jgi:hypothetical protein
MPEPTTTALGAATLAATGTTLPVIVLLGVPLGLRVDVLVAGFFGSLVAIILLNTVPSSGDTWIELVRTTVRRMCVTLASALTAGYLTPIVVEVMHLSVPWVVLMAFVVGAAAQKVLQAFIRRVESGIDSGATTDQKGGA